MVTTIADFEWAETIFGQQWEYCSGSICSAVEFMGGTGDSIVYSWSVIDDDLPPQSSQIVASGTTTGEGAFTDARHRVETAVREWLG